MNVPYVAPVRTMASLLHDLGDVPPERVRFVPTPGTATIDDLLKPENAHCELVDGTLVEKPVGWEETLLGARLVTLISNFVDAHDLGEVNGGDGFIELPSGPVRAPDVSFVSHARARTRQPGQAVPQFAPDLAVEVLSPSNTKAEMARKRDEYFRAGVRMVWEIDPRARTACVYTASDRYTDLTAADTLAGDPVLPGFTLPLAELFARLDRRQ
jgi:Uma2 family endonuclease